MSVLETVDLSGEYVIAIFKEGVYFCVLALKACFSYKNLSSLQIIMFCTA